MEVDTIVLLKSITFLIILISIIVCIPPDTEAAPARIDVGLRFIYHKDIQVYSPRFRGSHKFHKGRVVIGTHFDILPLIKINGTINVGQQYLLKMGLPAIYQFATNGKLDEMEEANFLFPYFMLYGSNFEFHINKYIALVAGHNVDIVIFKNKSNFQGAFITPHIGIDINGLPFNYRFTVSNGILWDFNAKNKNYDLTLGFSFYANMPTF